MGIITTASRIWLTRTFKPFAFKNEYDNTLKYSDCKNMGLYVHIPFCKQICSFCPYCKEIYDDKKCNSYIDSLIEEIHLVGKGLSEKKVVTSLYFGGGTPSLAKDRLKEIIDTLKLYYIITEGIGIELHPDTIDVETLKIIKDAGVNKISIGIQSFSEKYLSVLGRRNFDIEKLKESLKTVDFETVSMDFIFALPEQTIDDLISDIETAFNIGANHIAIYPFIDFSFTDSKCKPMKKKEKRRLLDQITLYCESKGYRRDSIWTFSNDDNAGYSSMTRDNFLGFGCSATTLIDDQFKINTFSVEEYSNRIKEHKLPTSLTVRFVKRQRMIYYLFWTAYSTKINIGKFEEFFKVPLKKMYGFELWLAKIFGFLTEESGEYKMTLKGAFYYHHYENYYTYSYIDQMWSTMKNNAFPEKIDI